MSGPRSSIVLREVDEPINPLTKLRLTEAGWAYAEEIRPGIIESYAPSTEAK